MKRLGYNRILFCYINNTSLTSKNITPGTENIEEKPNVYQLTPTVSGIKYDNAFTAHSAPIPPIILVNTDLKKLPLPLNTQSIIKSKTAPIP